jgi:hypothetical protein
MAPSHSLPQRPKLFVDSSTVGQHFAEILQTGLAEVADVTTACDGIADASRTFDLAVFVLGGVPEVGMLLRLGVFLGALGRERVVIICPASGVRDLPSELRDVTLATYSPSGNGIDHGAVGSVCATIKEHALRLTTPAGLVAGSEPPAGGAAAHVARRLRRLLGTACSVRSGQTLRIVDISLTGALLETYGEIPEHQLLDLDLTLENGRRIRVTAKVVRIQYPQWGRVGGVGVQFTRFEGESHAILQRYLETDPVPPAATSPS